MFVSVAIAFALFRTPLYNSKVALKEKDLLIVTDASWSAAHLNNLVNGSPGDDREEVAETELAKQGYFLWDKGGVRALIAPSIWQEDQVRRGREIATSLLKALQPNGLLDTDKDEQLSEFTGAFMNSVGVALADHTPIAIAGRSTYTLSNGERSVTIKGNLGLSESAAAATKGKPAKHGDKLLFNKLTQDNFRVNWPEEYEVFGFGKFRLGEARTEGLRYILEVIEFRLKNVADQKKKFSASLGNLLNGYDLSQYQGNLVSNLPDGAKNDILNQLTGRPGENGFNSAEDAQSFLKNATLSSSSFQGFLSVFVVSTSGNSFGVDVELP